MKSYAIIPTCTISNIPSRRVKYTLYRYKLVKFTGISHKITDSYGEGQGRTSRTTTMLQWPLSPMMFTTRENTMGPDVGISVEEEESVEQITTVGVLMCKFFLTD